jgi:hypothetical protein
MRIGRSDYAISGPSSCPEQSRLQNEFQRQRFQDSRASHHAERLVQIGGIDICVRLCVSAHLIKLVGGIIKNTCRFRDAVDCSVAQDSRLSRTLRMKARKRERVRCSSLIDWPVYPRLKRTMRASSSSRNLARAEQASG